MRPLLALALLPLAAAPAAAGEAAVTAAEARQADGLWTFEATVRHADAGWDHYADAWRVESTDGTIFGTRELFHPHVDEQPFTRSLSDVEIPEDVASVVIRARDNVHGWGRGLLIQLPR